MPTNTDFRAGWFCVSHNREATHFDKSGLPCCDPNLAGLAIACQCTFLSKDFQRTELHVLLEVAINRMKIGDDVASSFVAVYVNSLIDKMIP